jgi:hypothetical protein
MSPILKRDVSEQIRQAKRLAAAVTGQSPLETDHDHPQYETTNGNAYATSSSSRIGIGIGEDEDDPGPRSPRRSWEGRTFISKSPGKGKERALDLDLDEDGEVEEGVAMLGFQEESLLGNTMGRSTIGRGRGVMDWFRDEVLTMSPGRWIDLRNLLLEVCFSFHSGMRCS